MPVQKCIWSLATALVTFTVVVLPQTVACAEIDLGLFAAETPYDPYFQSVQEVLRNNQSEALTIEKVRRLLKTAHSFRYTTDDTLVPADPSVTGKKRAGDCKDKALWLCHAIGDPSLRFVVGKWRRKSNVNHAWLVWKKSGYWWILDPTNTSELLRADKVDKHHYQALYSWDRYGKYLHNTSSGYGIESASSRPAAVGAP